MNADSKCVYCELLDSDPKHQRVHPGHVSVYAHMDCCAQFTNCEICTPVVEFANGKRGDEFRAAISEYYATKG